MQYIVTCAMMIITRLQDGPMTQAAESDFYSIAQAAKLLGVSPSTVWRWIEADRLPAYRVGPKNIRIKKADLEQAVQPTRSTGKEEPMKEVGHVRSTLTVRPLTEDERQCGLRALREAKQLRERILARRGGKLLSPSWELIQEAREERAQQL